MRLIDYVIPVEECLHEHHLAQNTFGASVSVYTETFPDIKGAHIALVGIEGWGDPETGFRTGNLNAI